MEIKTYDLLTPISFGSQEITRLEFKPLKAKHLRALKGVSALDDTFVIASRITGHSSEIIDELSAEDCFNVVEIINGFLKRGPKTGDQSAQPSL